MAILRQELSAYRPSGPAAVTLGVFDGVHLGHRRLFAQLRAVADSHHASPVVVTFANHPLSVLQPDVPLLMLTPLEERLELIRATGIDHIVPISFTGTYPF